MENNCNPFAAVEACVVWDRKLSSGAVRLYAAIKMRCMGKRYMFVGHKRMAEDLGVSVSTVERQYMELRKRGLIKIVRRGPNQSAETHLVKSVSVVYGEAAEMPFPETDPSDLTAPDPSDLMEPCPQICGIEVEEVEVEEVEDLPALQDPSDEAFLESTKEGGAVERWASAEEAVTEAQRRNRQAVEERMQKKASRSAGKRPDAKKERITATDVERWFKSEVEEVFGSDLRQSKWTLKEKSNSKLLLDSYGPELVEKAISHMVKNWKDISERMKIAAAVPSIGVLTGYRDSIFGEVQVGVKRSSMDPRRGEYDSESAEKSPSAGWGDLAKRVGD